MSFLPCGSTPDFPRSDNGGGVIRPDRTNTPTSPGHLTVILKLSPVTGRAVARTCIDSVENQPEVGFGNDAIAHLYLQLIRLFER